MTTATTMLPEQADRRAQLESSTWLVGLADVDVSVVRRLVVAELISGSRWGQVATLAGTRRSVGSAEALLWVEQMVRTAGAVHGDVAAAEALGDLALERLPFAVVVTPDAVVLRWHRSLGDATAAQRLLQRLGAAGRLTRLVAA